MQRALRRCPLRCPGASVGRRNPFAPGSRVAGRACRLQRVQFSRVGQRLASPKFMDGRARRALRTTEPCKKLALTSGTPPGTTARAAPPGDDQHRIAIPHRQDGPVHPFRRVIRAVAVSLAPTGRSLPRGPARSGRRCPLPASLAKDSAAFRRTSVAATQNPLLPRVRPQQPADSTKTACKPADQEGFSSVGTSVTAIVSTGAQTTLRWRSDDRT